jgi:glutaredoxin 2
MEKLFLLKANFQDINRNAETKYFCPPCALIEGVLSFYPQLRYELEVTYVDFVRPRPAIIDLIGAENQGCPVLILEDGSFLNETDDIIQHLTEKYKIGQAH